MIGRGRVISLTPSGAHLGAGQELSNLLTLNPSKKFAEPRPHQLAPTKKGADLDEKSTP